MAIHRRHAVAGVDHEQAEISLGHRRLGLALHAAFERGGIGIVEAGRVDEREGETAERGLAHAAITRDARPIIDDGELPADEPVEER
jgi:hypothetical protein